MTREELRKHHEGPAYRPVPAPIESNGLDWPVAYALVIVFGMVIMVLLLEAF